MEHDEEAAPSAEEVSRFIASTFRSVWSIELLLLLRSERRVWAIEELIKALRASDMVVSQAFKALVASGLAIVDERGASYACATGKLERLVSETEAAYRRKPDQVRRIIVSAASSGLTDFADAFRLRRD